MPIKWSCAGLPCETEHSLCNGRNELCIGRGPAYDADDHGFQSNLIIAGRQAARAAELWSGQSADVSGETLAGWCSSSGIIAQPCRTLGIKKQFGQYAAVPNGIRADMIIRKSSVSGACEDAVPSCCNAAEEL